MLGLAAIGLRQGRLAAEVQKALETERPGDGSDDMASSVAATRAALATFVLDVQRDAEGTRRDHLTVGRSRALYLGASFPEGSPHHYASAEDVPEDLALTLAVNAYADILNDGESIALLVLMLPWIARASPEELYVPRAHLPLVVERWTPEHTRMLLHPFRRRYGNSYAARAPAATGPARGAPCPCGSGKKYKRCCCGSCSGPR